MNRLDKNIAENLKRIRKSKNMSLDMLAEQTGVSKSMLGQIERGESHPTVATVEKIMEGLRIPFEDLFYVKEDVVLVDNAILPPYRHKENSFELKAIFPYDRKRSFEVFEMTIEAGSEFSSNPREDHTYEYITVIQGELTVEIGNKEYVISENQSIRFLASTEHSYKNTGKKEMMAQLVLSHEGTSLSASGISFPA